jgi:hypothetical protein
MSAAMMSLIIMWCSGVKSQGPAIINEPDRQTRCREYLVKCVGESETTISSDCLRGSLE